MLNVITENPFRMLGVYANAPTKDRVANKGKIAAFLKVNKVAAFPTDTFISAPVRRTEESVARAEGHLALANEQLKYAQFWFLKMTPMDDIAFNNLGSGNRAMAIEIWTRRDSVSSLQNRIVCLLDEENYPAATLHAVSLYGEYGPQFIETILGNTAGYDEDVLMHNYLDAICEEVASAEVALLMQLNLPERWKMYLKEKLITPLIAAIESSIAEAKAKKGQGHYIRYNAGRKLMNDTKPMLEQLKALLDTSDLQYQMIADKLGLEILDCGIEYFISANGEDANAPHAAMELQGYALSVVQGSMAKQRCQDNVDILKKIIADMPPHQVAAEAHAILNELKQFCALPDKIEHSITLLNNTKGNLQIIKNVLGANAPYYLKLSTQVVNGALHNLIEEVNNAQKETKVQLEGFPEPISIDFIDTRTRTKRALEKAWEATLIMDKFDMEIDFKNNRYMSNRDILKRMCDDFGISTQKTPSPRPTPMPRPTPTPPPTVAPRPKPTPPTESKESSSDWWNWVAVAAAVILLLRGCV